MMYNELIKGECYNIITKDKSSCPNHVENVRYVRREKFPKSGTEWDTFYTFFSGTTINCSEGLVNMDGIMQRIRIPAGSIQMIHDTTILSDGELVTKLIQDPDNRTPLVDGWLKEVQEIICNPKPFYQIAKKSLEEISNHR
jgi:hypothetical protein